MYYSVTFTNADGVSKNTWTDWKLIPSSPPMIEPPEVYTNYVEIPGRVGGPIDLSEALSDGPSYNSSQGSWSFVSGTGEEDRAAFYLELKAFLHGRAMKVRLEEDPDHYYEGRFSVERPQTGRGRNVYSIRYVLSPIRYRNDGTADGI